MASNQGECPSRGSPCGEALVKTALDTRDTTYGNFNNKKAGVFKHALSLNPIVKLT